MSATTPDVTPVPPATQAAPGGARQWAVPASLAAVYLIWGSTYLALKWMVDGIPPLLGAGCRYLLAGSVLYGVLRLRGAPAPTRRQWLASIPTGVLLFLIGNGFVTLAEREISSSVAAIVCATMPLLTAALGTLGGERVSRREIVGLSIGFAGVAVMTAKELSGASLSASLILLAPIGWSLGTFAARKLDQPKGLMSAAIPMLTGGVATLAAGALTGEHVPQTIPSRSVVAFFYLVIYGSLVAFSAYSHLLRQTRPSVATSYAYVNPVVAMLLGVAIGGETLGAFTLLGGALVIAGVIVVVRSRSSKTS